MIERLYVSRRGLTEIEARFGGKGELPEPALLGQPLPPRGIPVHWCPMLDLVDDRPFAFWPPGSDQAWYRKAKDHEFNLRLEGIRRMFDGMPPAVQDAMEDAMIRGGLPI